MNQNRKSISFRIARMCCLVGVVICLGCSESSKRLQQFEALKDRHQERWAEVYEQVDRVLAASAQQPDPSDAFLKRLVIDKQMRTYQSLLDKRDSNTDAEQKQVQESCRIALSILKKERATLEDELKLPKQHRIRFSGPDANAGTLLLSKESGSASLSLAGLDRDRNSAADWLELPVPDLALSVEEVEKLWSKAVAMEYLLVVRPIETRLAKQISDSQYRLGGMLASAFLFELKSGELLVSYRFQAPNQSFGHFGVDFTLVEGQHDSNIETINRRLYVNAHRFAEATSAEIADSIKSPFRVKRTPFLTDELVDTRDE